MIFVSNKIVKKAEKISFDAHFGQYRRDGKTMYFTHPKAVADGLSSPSAKVVGYLHDVLEDTKVTERMLIAHGIPKRLVEVVKILSKRHCEDYFEYLVRIKKNKIAREVKIKDILHNLSDDPTPRQVKKYSLALEFLLD